MNLPLQFDFFGITIPAHFFFEILAFALGFRYYVYLRKKSKDKISFGNRLSIILGAVIGAFLGSRIVAFLENPAWPEENTFMILMNIKTIMGGLFGGLLGVEIAKKIIGEKQSSGDLFVFPIILGIGLGRIGCFLAGTSEFTYGKPTQFFMGMNLGDGLLRHPIALYEVIFLIILFIVLKQLKQKGKLISGELFKIFMIVYFSFRFFIEFLKPNTFYWQGLSSIQWLCIICLLYYSPYIYKKLTHANPQIHLL